MWDLIVSVPDHCLSFYFKGKQTFFITNAPLLQKMHMFYMSKRSWLFTFRLGTVSKTLPVGLNRFYVV